LRFQTVDSITRISATSAAAAQAGAQIGDALFKIGAADVWGVSAQQIAPFFVGPAGADGSFRALVSFPDVYSSLQFK
jgi:hypothetical protein